MSFGEWQEYEFMIREICNYSDLEIKKLSTSYEQLIFGAIFGAILGTVEIVDCVEESDSPWFFGDYGFVLQNPRPFEQPIFCKGALGFWEVPKDIEAHFNYLDK